MKNWSLHKRLVISVVFLYAVYAGALFVDLNTTMDMTPTGFAVGIPTSPLIQVAPTPCQRPSGTHSSFFFNSMAKKFDNRILCWSGKWYSWHPAFKPTAQMPNQWYFAKSQTAPCITIGDFYTRPNLAEWGRVSDPAYETECKALNKPSIPTVPTPVGAPLATIADGEIRVDISKVVWNPPLTTTLFRMFRCDAQGSNCRESNELQKPDSLPVISLDQPTVRGTGGIGTLGFEHNSKPGWPSPGVYTYRFLPVQPLNLKDYYRSPVEPAGTMTEPSNQIIVTAPNIIEAEDFDCGISACTGTECSKCPDRVQNSEVSSYRGKPVLEGISYSDDANNDYFSSYRNGPVDVFPSKPYSNRFGVGGTRTNEWMIYTRDISAGTYRIKVDYATIQPAEIELHISHKSKPMSIALPSTGGGNTLRNVLSEPVSLVGGQNSFVLKINSGGVNLDKLELIPLSAQEQLIAHYPFDGSANDVIGKIDGVFTDPKYGPGVQQKGQAAQFDGTNKIQIQRNPSVFGDLGTFTIVFWMKQNVFRTFYDGILAAVHDQEEDDTLENFFIASTDSNVLLGTRSLYLSPTPVGVKVDGNWHEVRIIVVEGEEIDYYLDGVLAKTYKPIQKVVFDDLNNVIIGSRRNRDGTGYNGLIDDLKIYTGVVVPEQVAKQSPPSFFRKPSEPRTGSFVLLNCGIETIGSESGEGTKKWMKECGPPSGTVDCGGRKSYCPIGGRVSNDQCVVPTLTPGKFTKLGFFCGGAEKEKYFALR